MHDAAAIRRRDAPHLLSQPPMSIPDIVVLLILGIFALSGLRRGVVWELLTTIGLLLGFAATFYFRAELFDLVVRWSSPGWQRQWVGGLIFLAIFLLIYLGFAAIGKHIHEGLQKTAFKWPDHILGFAGGLFKGAVLIAMLVLVIEWFGADIKVYRLINDSTIIRWGKQQVHNLIRWESPEQQRWVCRDSVAADPLDLV
jgi:uncharacterized membrane protein required for colicin V production